LEALVEKLLFAARIEGEEITLDDHSLDLSNLYRDLYELYAERYEQDFSMTGSFQDDLWVRGDEVLIRSIFINLLDNAVKYCPAGGHIRVSLASSGHQAILQVANDGIHIAEGEKKKIWDKFYRVGDEHTRSSIGTGLGLYIVKRIVDSHHGTAVVRDIEDNGVVFEITLPLIMTTT
jgi:signal transduction histidine kinase